MLDQDKKKTSLSVSVSQSLSLSLSLCGLLSNTIMLEGKAAMGETDMPVVMQHHAMRCASRALDIHDVSDCQSIAAYMKKVRVNNLSPSHTTFC